ncbi:nucleotidyl transferase AbiEii/AbiGii toxin family protein [Azospirillum sp. SYSU D00513]|uniref:nucleotidyl transferase AbiEii/AbiGii toxin family protein n=1 Tax=Azospirillum sp. SYSU D00513 TaxID=2812561 RepID=UPI001A9627D2|nr:nucleotidyl transferase AbiEii/AbiGii toxin family protein [Azospirillum sp. SYSU D00513]
MPSYPVPDGPHNDDWKSLLAYLFPVVGEVVQRHGLPFPIQIGGGSMLLRRYRHRKSRDLDVFVTDARLVRLCSPRINEAAADIFVDYGEEASAVKLVLGMQEIDIIAVAPVITDEATEEAVLKGRDILIERPREILAKKVVYRGRTFQPRDVFDLACIAVEEPEEVAAILPWLSPTHLDDLAVRLDEIEPILDRELADKVEAYPDFQPVIGKCLDITRGVLATWKEELTPKVQAPPHPQHTHRAIYSRDGSTVVIKERNPETQRFERIGNTLGPAKVAPEGVSYWLAGIEMPEAEWRLHPAVLAALRKA